MNNKMEKIKQPNPEGGSWTERIGSINNLLLFCKDWTRREDIAKHFNLTSQMSANAAKLLKTYYSDVETRKGRGLTARALEYKTKQSTLEEIEFERNL